MDKSFSPQPPEESSFNYQDDEPAWNSHPHSLSGSSLNATSSMDRTHSGTDQSDSSGGSYFRWDSPSPPPATSSPQRGSPQVDRTSSPLRFGSYGSYHNSDKTYSDGRTYSGTDQSLSGSSVDEDWYNQYSRSAGPGPVTSTPRSQPQSSRADGSTQVDRTSSPLRFGSYGSYNHSDNTYSDGRTYSGAEQSFSGSSAIEDEQEARRNELLGLNDQDESLVDDVFEEGVYPIVLREQLSPGYRRYNSRHLDRGFYPAHLEAGAEDWDPLPLFHEPPTPPLRADWKYAVFHPNPRSPYGPAYPRGFHSPGLDLDSPELKRVQAYGTSADPHAPSGPVVGSPPRDRTSSPNRFGSYGSYHPSDKTSSDGRTYSGTDQSILGSIDDEVFDDQYPNSTEPVGYTGTPSPRPAVGSPQGDRTSSPLKFGSYGSYHNSDKTYSDGRTYSGTDQSLSGSSDYSAEGYAEDYTDYSNGIQKSVSITSPGKRDPLQLNVRVEPRSISQSPSGNRIICGIGIGVQEALIQPRRRHPYMTPPVTETVRRYDRKHGMFTPKSIYKQGSRAVRNLFDVSPQPYSPRSPRWNRTIEWEDDYLNREFDFNLNRVSPSQSHHYQTPSYEEPENPAWTYPRSKKGIPVSPEQDLISAVEDQGFEYYHSPMRSPPKYYPETN